MSEGESVESVLEDLIFDIEGGPMLLAYVLGDVEPSALSYEDWTAPMKLSGGRICLRIDRGVSPDWYVRRTEAGLLEGRENEHTPPWPMSVRELRGILDGDATREGRVQPVLRSETPFNGGNDEG